MLLANALWLGLGLADWLVLAGYFVVILGIGIWSYRRVKNMSDFFMGGRRFGKIFMMFFAFGSGTSGEQAVSVVAGTWRVGLAGIWWQFLWLWATPFYWIVAPVMRRMRALTTADFFQSRFSTSTASLYAIYGIITSIVFMAGGLYGAGKMVDALTGGELERAADQLDVQVPEIRWDLINKSFGRGVMFEMPAETQPDSGENTLPALLREQLARRKRLSEELVVSEVEPGQRWILEDRGRNVTYPIERFTAVETERPAGGGEPREIEVQKLRVYGSGWRTLAGYEYAILAMTLMFLIYGMAGGLGAAIITDFIQGVLTIIFSFLLLPFVFKMIGGFGHLHDEGELKSEMFSLFTSPERGREVAELLGQEPITIFYVVMLSVTALAGIVVQPHIMGVCGAGKTEMEGRFGFTFGNFLKRFCTMAWTFTGLAAIVWYLGAHSPLKHPDKPLDQQAAEFQQLSQEEQEQVVAEFMTLPEAERQEIESDRQLYRALTARASESFAELTSAERGDIDAVDKDFADKLFGRAAYEILPTILPGLVGLLLAALLASVMSSADAQMVVSSGLFTENIYRRFVSRRRSQRHYLWVGRIAGLVIVILALILQSTFTDVIDALKVIIKTPAAIGISLWIGIVWRGWTPLAVWASTIGAASTWAFVAYRPDLLLDWGLPETMFNEKGNLFDAWTMLAYLSAGVISGLVVSLITPRTPKPRLDHFFRLIHTPVKPGEKVDTPCTLPDDHLPQGEKLLNVEDIELPRPTLIGIGGFLAAWICVGLIVWLTWYLARVW